MCEPTKVLGGQMQKQTLSLGGGKGGSSSVPNFIIRQNWGAQITLGGGSVLDIFHASLYRVYIMITLLLDV